MKNMKKIISFIVLAIMVILPMGVHAAVSFDILCDPIDYESRTKTCDIMGYATDGSGLTKFTGTLELKNLSLKSFTAASPWVDASNGTSLNLSSTTSVTASSFKIATAVFDVSEDVSAESSCEIVLEPCTEVDGTTSCENNPIDVTPTYSCKVVNGTYYGKDGSVVTEEEYNSACVSNPQTGNFLPYVVIGAGIALAAIVFTVSRKNNKLYKI
jgi:hypothetical protein